MSGPAPTWQPDSVSRSVRPAVTGVPSCPPCMQETEFIKSLPIIALARFFGQSTHLVAKTCTSTGQSPLHQERKRHQTKYYERQDRYYIHVCKVGGLRLHHSLHPRPCVAGSCNWIKPPLHHGLSQSLKHGVQSAVTFRGMRGEEGLMFLGLP